MLQNNRESILVQVGYMDTGELLVLEYTALVNRLFEAQEKSAITIYKAANELQPQSFTFENKKIFCAAFASLSSYLITATQDATYVY